MTSNEKFNLMLLASKHYYIDDDPIMSDYEYDKLTREISTLENLITDKRKQYVDFEALKSCSSLHYLKYNMYEEL